MKVLLINGSPNEHGCTHRALTEAEKTLNAQGIDTQRIWVGRQGVPGCMGCGACRKLGKCVIDDVVNQAVAAAKDCGGIIVGSPVHYGGASGQITSFLNRFFYSSAGSMAGKLGASVVSCRRGGATAAFQQLNMFFGMNHVHLVSSQYWNQVHGNTPEQVEQDLEGLQTIRAMADNMAWLLKCVEAGEKAGIVPPEREKRVNTNFIR